MFYLIAFNDTFLPFLILVFKWILILELCDFTGIDSSSCKQESRIRLVPINSISRYSPSPGLLQRIQTGILWVRERKEPSLDALSVLGWLNCKPRKLNAWLTSAISDCIFRADS